MLGIDPQQVADAAAELFSPSANEQRGLNNL
jgi:hypothetical protein